MLCYDKSVLSWIFGSAELVSFLFQVDYQIQTLYAQLTDRQKKYAKYAEQIKKVGEMQTVLNKVKMNVEQTLPLMERLNSVLPEEDQMEPFSMSGAMQKWMIWCNRIIRNCVLVKYTGL